MDQLNNEIHEKWCSTNVDETTVMAFISIKFVLVKIAFLVIYSITLFWLNLC